LIGNTKVSGTRIGHSWGRNRKSSSECKPGENHPPPAFAGSEVPPRSLGDPRTLMAHRSSCCARNMKVGLMASNSGPRLAQ
jgi:hypothetical protein